MDDAAFNAMIAGVFGPDAAGIQPNMAGGMPDTAGGMPDMAGGMPNMGDTTGIAPSASSTQSASTAGPSALNHNVGDGMSCFDPNLLDLGFGNPQASMGAPLTGSEPQSSGAWFPDSMGQVNTLASGMAVPSGLMGTGMSEGIMEGYMALPHQGPYVPQLPAGNAVPLFGPMGTGMPEGGMFGVAPSQFLAPFPQGPCMSQLRGGNVAAPSGVIDTGMPEDAATQQMAPLTPPHMKQPLVGNTAPPSGFTNTGMAGGALRRQMTPPLRNLLPKQDPYAMFLGGMSEANTAPPYGLIDTGMPGPSQQRTLLFSNQSMMQSPVGMEEPNQPAPISAPPATLPGQRTSPLKRKLGPRRSSAERAQAEQARQARRAEIETRPVNRQGAVPDWSQGVRMHKRFCPNHDVAPEVQVCKEDCPMKSFGKRYDDLDKVWVPLRRLNPKGRKLPVYLPGTNIERTVKKLFDLDQYYTKLEPNTTVPLPPS